MQAQLAPLSTYSVITDKATFTRKSHSHATLATTCMHVAKQLHLQEEARLILVAASVTHLLHDLLCECALALKHGRLCRACFAWLLCNILKPECGLPLARREFSQLSDVNGLG